MCLMRVEKERLGSPRGKSVFHVGGEEEARNVDSGPIDLT